MSQRDREFDLRMLEIAREEFRATGVQPGRFLGMLAEHGGVGTAKHLIAAPTIPPSSFA